MQKQWGDCDFYLSQSHYIDTDPTSKEKGSKPSPPDNKFLSTELLIPSPGGQEILDCLLCTPDNKDELVGFWFEP